MPDQSIRPLDRLSDLPWASAILDAELGGRMQARRGELIDAIGDGGLVGMAGGQPVALLTWALGIAASAEIRAVVVTSELRGQGVGRALIEAAHQRLGTMGVRHVWLVTTNDNVPAIGLYQQLGYRLVALRPGAVDESRRTLKPSIGEIGAHGIPIHDELELELELQPG
jgi:ribosomal protein S18 acetylase RimI-like enzyme